MDVRERILVSRILEKIQDKPQYGKTLGIEVTQVALSNGINAIKKKRD